MKKSVYDADEDGIIDEGASYPHTHVHATTTQRDADDHTHYHNDERGDARYVQIQSVLHGWCLADQYKQVINGYWIFENSADYWFYTKISQHEPAIDYEIEYELFARAGERTFQALCQMGPDSGIFVVEIDDVPQGALSLYYSSLYENTHQELPVTVIGTGTHSVKLVIVAKHPFSSDYFIRFASVRIK